MSPFNLAAIFSPRQQQHQKAAQASEKGKTVKTAKRILWQVAGLTLLILLLSAVCSASAVWT